MYSTLPFETLIMGKEPSPANRWYPLSISTYKSAFNKLNMSFENSRALKSNLAYSLQYLEFLEKELSELKISDVIYVMLVKTYVITAMSVLEGLFSNIVKSNGWWKMDDKVELVTFQSNDKIFEGKRCIIKSEIYEKVEKYPCQMTLDELITRLDNHHDALQVNHLVYPALRRLKEFRNPIHLQKNEFETDHDYNAFDYRVKQEMGSILYEILTSPMVTDYPQYFEFLKTNETASGNG